MKKIGIITILRVNNFGAELQAFATQRAFQNLGYDSEIIDYLYYRHPNHKREMCSLPFFRYPFKNIIKEIGLVVRDIIIAQKKAKEKKERDWIFGEFHRDNTKMSPKQYYKMSDLYKENWEYDVYCVGSDQVWNPRCFTSLYPYFLTFAPEGKRFSYASSFGVSSLPENAKKKYAECINGLSYIGVREKSGVDLVKSLTGKEATLVCDPTLLLNREEWLTIAKAVKDLPDKYLLIYELHEIPFLKEVALRVAKEKKLKVVRICKDAIPVETDGSILNLTTIGPSEFVYLFANADFVITNSFHGTAFSINMNKDFYTIATRKKNNNSRQIGLLTTCDLKDRLLYENQDLPAVQTFTIDYHKPNERLEALRSHSKNYIKRAIDGE